MRGLAFAGLVVGQVAFASLASASDHNNLDDQRPLRFEDAYSIGFRGYELQFGLGTSFLRRGAPRLEPRAEFKYGFALNRHLEVGYDPTVRRGDATAHGFDVSYFHSLQREIGRSPALAYRLDLATETERGAQRSGGRIRGVATRALGQYDRLHLNLDANLEFGSRSRSREVALAAILGYSRPVGYPTRFDQTLVAQLAVQQSRVRGEGSVGTVGLGLRRQIGHQSVFDIGIESDVFATRRAERSAFRLVVGYTRGF